MYWYLCNNIDTAVIVSGLCSYSNPLYYYGNPCNNRVQTNDVLFTHYYMILTMSPSSYLPMDHGRGPRADNNGLVAVFDDPGSTSRWNCWTIWIHQSYLPIDMSYYNHP